MKHLILVGACYLDTILSVPRYPEEDSKLRATKLSFRRGGNCPNTLQVLQQLLDRGGHDARAYLVSCLPQQSSLAARRIIESLGDRISLAHCLYRDGHTEAASSYIVRSEASGSRTIVNYSDLPEMTVGEFAGVVRSFGADQDTWWHFEGRIPDTTLDCIRLLRSSRPTACVSVEVEKPGRQGLPELAAEADVTFYSRTWAESRGHKSAEACLRNEQRRPGSLGLCTWGADGAAAISQSSGDLLDCSVQHVPVVDTVGAGDTFIAGVLYGLACQHEAWDLRRSLRFAVDLATLKVQREGFEALGADAQGFP